MHSKNADNNTEGPTEERRDEHSDILGEKSDIGEIENNDQNSSYLKLCHLYAIALLRYDVVLLKEHLLPPVYQFRNML